MYSYQPVRPAQPHAGNASHQAPPPRWGQAACVVLFVVLALTLVQCVRLGVAGLMVQTAQAEVDQWTPASPHLGTPEISRLGNIFSASLQYATDNPWALEGLGAVDLARMRASRIPREALAAAKDARLHFRHALAQRPTSPFLWANLALAKLYLNEIDAEFFAALRHAEELGPWEPNVQQTTLFAGLAVWPELDPGLKQTMVRTIERGGTNLPLRILPERIFNIVKSYGRFDLICAIKKYETIAGPDCKKVGVSAEPGEPPRRR